MKHAVTIKTITSITTLTECVDIMITAYNRPPWNNHWTPDKAKALLKCYYHTPEFMGWVAVQDNKIVGCATGNVEPYFDGDIFYLRELFVDVNHQQTGIGSLLMATIKNDLKLKGITNALLFTYRQVTPFYSKFGFNELSDICVMMDENF